MRLNFILGSKSYNFNKANNFCKHPEHLSSAPIASQLVWWKVSCQTSKGEWRHTYVYRKHLRDKYLESC